MPNTLREELRQTKPFASQCQEASLNIARTASVLTDGIEAVLKPFGIGMTQYNVLRILRGASPDGLCRNEIRDRLISRMPDVTRLLDRMEDAGLVTRTRGHDDRRLVSTHLTDAGSALLARVDGLVAAEHGARLGHLTGEQLEHLVALLTLVRHGG